MPARKRKKASRLRGSKTHSHGAKKKWRGKGNRGGAGMAGSGKRGDQKKPSIWKKDYFGRKYFRSKKLRKDKVINVSFIEENLEKFLKNKVIEEKNGVYVVDLKKIGFNKLIGKGKVKHKFSIVCEKASKKAIEKVKKAGGDVKVLEEEELKNLEKKQDKIEIKTKNQQN